MSFWTGEKIKQARRVLDITQGELAQALGSRQQTISEWEMGTHTPGPAYQQLLSLTIDDLFRKRGVRNEGQIFASDEQQKGAAPGAGVSKSGSP